MPDFGKYDGRPIRKSSLKITGTGDGLSDALAVEPVDLHPKDVTYVVLEIEAGDVNHKYMADADAWNRVQSTKALRGAFVEAAIAKPLLDNVTVARKEQQAAEGDDLELETLSGKAFTELGETAQGRLIEHVRQLHNRKRRDCPACQGTASDEQLAQADAEASGDQVGSARAKRARKATKATKTTKSTKR